MAENPACREFVPQLSPYVDGELFPQARMNVERHLVHCAICTGRVADFRAEAGLVRVGLDMLADDADFTGFAQKVMARVTPKRLPLWEGLRLGWTERWTYQRGGLVSALGVAAAVLILAPVGWKAQQAWDAAPVHLSVRSVRVDPAAHVAPMVMSNDQTGDAIIWLVDHDDHSPVQVDASSEDELPKAEGVHPHPPPARLPREQPSGGDL